jgi:hypothetical protein
VIRWAPRAVQIALASVCETPAIGEPKGLEITLADMFAVAEQALFQS